MNKEIDLIQRGKRLARTWLLWSLLAIPGLYIAGPARAQSDLEPGKRANVVLRLDLARYHASPMSKLFPTAALAQNNPMMMGEFQDVDLQQLQEIHILLQAPQSLEAVMAMDSDSSRPLPFNFVLAARSTDKGAFDGFRNMVENDSVIENVNDATYFRPPNGPGNVAAVFGDDGLARIGTDDFLGRSFHAGMSDEVAKRVGQMPASVLQLMIDLRECGDVIDELIEMNGLDNPAARPFIEALEGVAFISGTVDFDSEKMVQLHFTARQADKVESIRTALDALVGLVQTLARGEEVPKLAQAILNDMKVTVDGQTVSVVATAPADMVEQLKNDVLPVMQAEAERVNEMNDLKQVALAMHMYCDTYRAFPQFVAHTSELDLSWRVLVLPFLEEDALYRKLDIKQAWDAEANQALRQKMPSVFGSEGKTRIAAVKLDPPVKFFDKITDGTSNTIAFVQINEALPWAANGDVTINDVLAMFENMKGEGAVLVAFYDGSVQSISAKTPVEQLKAMLTPNGGEIVDR